jgi:hypothetical protein
MVTQAMAAPATAEAAPWPASPYGPLLYSAGSLVVRLRGILAEDTSPCWTPITATTRADVTEDRGPALYLYGGWALSLGGAALALLLSDERLGLFAGLLIAFSGSHLVRCHLERCTTRLVIRNGTSVQEVESRVRKLGDDIQALHLAKQAVDHAAALLHAAAVRHEEGSRQPHTTAPAEDARAARHADA